MDAASHKAKWEPSTLTERSSSQSHFNDLCVLLGHPTPTEADPTGEWFTFEKGAEKSAGGDGFADVWKRGFFAWEYKGKHKDLDAAYQQLLQYRESLDNPPLLVVCDIDRIIIRTNFTNTPTEKHVILLSGIDLPDNLAILRAVFFEPERLKPGKTYQQITEDAARQIGDLAKALRERGHDPHDVARFLDRIVFCLFAEDVELLPDAIFSQLLQNVRFKPETFARRVKALFDIMATGGEYGVADIRHFNGNLFDSGGVLELTAGELIKLRKVAELDWGQIDASIFGTLFERGLDPAKRSQLGAHYTSREDIETLVRPVVMAPLRREWDEARAVVECLLSRGVKSPDAPAKPVGPKAREEARLILRRVHDHLARVTVLDPACGSGNFLFVTLQLLKDLEHEIITYAVERGFTAFAPLVGPWQLFGLEISPYAHDLAQMTVWIGYLQWTHRHGGKIIDDPVLRANNNFRCMDAILDLSDPEQPREPEWPKADYVVGNPPFLGDKLMRRELGDTYVDQLRALYAGRIPGQSDLCCYWFERARAEIVAGRAARAGLLSTQGIRGGANREVLKRIKVSGDIFFAESDRPWVLNGANVHVSMAAFDDGTETERVLDGETVRGIAVNLTPTINGDHVAGAKVIPANAHICFLGIMKAGPFDMGEELALPMLKAPSVGGKPNSDVLRLRVNGQEMLQRGSGWILDFGCGTSAQEAMLRDEPWRYVESHVKPTRENNRRQRLADRWWIHGEPRPGMRAATAGLSRFILTPEVSKHRVFAWFDSVYLPDHQTRVFARDDDYFFGVLHSCFHEIWALKLGTRLETRPRYTPTTCFETFPLPEPTPEQTEAIAAAACALNALREAWLNPPEWTREDVLEFPGSADGPWARYLHDPDARGIGTVRYPRLVARDAACGALLAKRTLTNLYNARPAWLDQAHRALDAAVAAAYGWPADLPDAEVLARLLALNQARAG